jgi:hypothetical protein
MCITIIGASRSMFIIFIIILDIMLVTGLVTGLVGCDIVQVILWRL